MAVKKGRIMITCPKCGLIPKNDIQIYNENLRMQSFSMSPILPACKHCASDIYISHRCNGGNIIVLTGTCGSGKSTVAELLSGKGFLAIDGDCVIQSVRYKKGRKQYEWDELINEIACEIDILSLFTNNMVLSHVILPEDLDKYIDIFKARNMKCSFFLLKPAYETAVERCMTRTCHASITPEYWIRHFYDLLSYDERVFVVDNTNMTPDETTEYIFMKGKSLNDPI